MSETRVVYKNEVWVIGISKALFEFRKRDDQLYIMTIYKEFNNRVNKLAPISELTLKGGRNEKS